MPASPTCQRSEKDSIRCLALRAGATGHVEVDDGSAARPMAAAASAEATRPDVNAARSGQPGR
jgi:hypothetical protein